MAVSQELFADRKGGAILPMAGGPPDGFFSQMPNKLPKPLVSTKIMDFEWPVMKKSMSKKEFDAKKDELVSLIETIYKTVREEGYNVGGKKLTRDPKNNQELLALCRKILPMVWKRYQFNIDKSGTVTSSLANGTLDCDTSCFIVADILNQFGVKSWLVSTPEHVLLKVAGGSGSFYLETASPDALYYSDLPILKVAYPHVYGEFPFLLENPVSYHNRGLAKAQLGDFKGAISDFEQSLKLEPNNAEAYSDLAGVKINIGDFKGAIADIDMAIKLNPDSWSFYSNRGVAKANIGDFEGAIIDFSTSISLNKTDPDAYFNRGVIQYQSGDSKGAKKDLLKSADLYEAQGRVEDAKKARELAAQL